MSEVAAEDEHLARLQFTWRPSRIRDPFRLDAIVLFVDWDVHLVASANDFEAAVLHACGIDGEKDGEVLDFLDVSVRGGVDVGREATTTGELVVDLFFEEEHGFGGEAVEYGEDSRATE